MQTIFKIKPTMNTHYSWKQIPVKDTPPTPKWLPIDMDNLPIQKVVAIDYPAFNDVYYGALELTEDNRIRLYIGGGSYLYRLTHYIPLSDLLNLPISE